MSMGTELKRRLTAALAWGAVVLASIPIGWMLLGSLQDSGDILTGQAARGAGLRWSNYLDLWTQIDFFSYFTNSLLVCSLTTLFSTVFSVCAAYALARFPFPGAHAITLSITATQVIPGMLFFLPVYMMYRMVEQRWSIPLLDTSYGLVLLYTALFTPASIWVMRGFFVSVPRELEEAALIDGCGRFEAFWRVVLPTCLPGMIATATFVFLLAWDELFFASLLTQSPSVQTLPAGIRLFISQYQQRYDLLMAAGVVTTVPVLVAFFLAQRWFVKGLTAGALKG